MRNRFLSIISLACCLSVGPLYGAPVRPNHQYPRLEAGVTGVYLTVEKDLVVTVDSIEPGSPADGKPHKSDVVLSAVVRLSTAYQLTGRILSAKYRCLFSVHATLVTWNLRRAAGHASCEKWPYAPLRTERCSNTFR